MTSCIKNVSDVVTKKSVRISFFYIHTKIIQTESLPIENIERKKSIEENHSFFNMKIFDV